MHVTHRYHCEGSHTLYYNHRNALLFLSLSLSIIKNASQNQQPDTTYDFLKIKKKNGIYMKALFIKRLQTKCHQNRTRKKEVIAYLVMEWKSRTFRKCLLPGPLIFDFYSDSESSRWGESNGVCPIEIGRLVFEIWRWGAGPPPPPVNVLQKAHQ